MSRKSLISMIKAEGEYEKMFLSSLSYTIVNSQEKYIPSKTLKPSSIRCPRCAVMQVLGFPTDQEQRTESSIFITECGTFTHENIQRYFTKMTDWEYLNVGNFVREKHLPLEIKKEQNIENGEYETKLYSPEYNMSFLCDGVVKHKKSGKYFILEIKSIGNQGMYRLDGVPDKYKDQAVSYSQLLRIPSIIFLFVNRDIGNKKSFLYTPSREEIRNWQQKITDCLNCINLRILPDIPPEASSSYCQYCNFKESCGR